MFSLRRPRAVLAAGQRGARLPARRRGAVPAHLPAPAAADRPARPQPIVAILALQIVGSIIVALVRGGDPEPHPDAAARRRARRRRRGRSTRPSRRVVRSHARRSASGARCCRSSTSCNVRNTGVAFGLLADGGALLIAGTGVALVALLAFVAEPQRPPAACGCPPGCCSAAPPATCSTACARAPSPTSSSCPRWPAFNVADIAITLGVVALLYVLEGAPRRREAEAAHGRADGR